MEVQWDPEKGKLKIKIKGHPKKDLNIVQSSSGYIFVEGSLEADIRDFTFQPGSFCIVEVVDDA